MTTPIPEDKQKEIHEKLQHLVDTAFQNGLLAAIDEARTMNDPYLLDAFHDTLVDKLYQELITRHKLDELK